MNPRVCTALRDWIRSLPPGAVFDCYDAAAELDRILPRSLKPSNQEIGKCIGSTPGVIRAEPHVSGKIAKYTWRGGA